MAGVSRPAWGSLLIDVPRYPSNATPAERIGLKLRHLYSAEMVTALPDHLTELMPGCKSGLKGRRLKTSSLARGCAHRLWAPRSSQEWSSLDAIRVKFSTPIDALKLFVRNFLHTVDHHAPTDEFT